ncbi:MAG TPA: ATP-binding protein [Vicinamibacterales bacterium]|jgi:signal transduction histidine kinase|nr:ATP-binding protein [Vicinamibacterales bacterium]
MTTRHGDDRETETLRARLAEAEEMLRAIRQGDIDALVVEGVGGNQVYTLHSAEEPYRNLVEQMQEGAVVLKSRGDILYANARFAALVGEPLQSVTGSHFARFVDASDKYGVETLLGVGNGRGRCRLLRPDSGAFEVSLSLTTTRSTYGDRRNLIVTDMTELLEAHRNRDRAERDSRTKDEFLALLAHELRSPLGAISAAAQVLKVTHAAGRPETRAHDVIARQVGHISRLVDDLLDIERVVSGKIRLNRQALDLADVVRGAVATFAADAQLDRQIDVCTEPAWVDGDAVRIEQVLTNLLTNAVKYTPPGGRIRVALGASGADAVLSVEDSGFGISPSLLPFIFDMYVQAGQTLNRARGGLGIGLALVRRLVELHGGTVAASSDGEGKGSSFTVRLRKIPLPETSSGVSFPRERRAKPRRVLLIEDTGEAREMLRVMLELAGHVVYKATDGVRGIELLNVARPQVAIIDVSLPGIDGYEVARRIREKPHGRGMLLLALTGHGSPGDSKHSLEHGFDYHLVKPVDPDYVARLIGEVAEGS